MKKTIEKITDYAVTIADPYEIILFGSMADNKANEFSDVDLLIICDNVSSWPHIQTRLRSFASEIALKIDILIFSRESFWIEINKPDSFAAAVRKKGKVVYKKPI